jgi:hypothetical protein
MGVYEIVIVLSLAAHKQLKKSRSTVSEMLTCNQMLNHESGAVALWWKGRPLTPFQENSVQSLLSKVEKLECPEFLIIRVGETGEPASNGCFHDHPFQVGFRTTLEVSDGR